MFISLLGLFIVGSPLISCIKSKDTFCLKSTTPYVTPYMYKLELAANLLEKIRLCEQFVEVAGATDNDGRTYITYKAKINDDSEAKQMCDCLTASNFPSNFTRGAKHVCFVEGDTLTQLLIGGQDPNYDPKKPHTIESPINFLGELINNFPRSDVGGSNCVFTTGLNPSGFYHILTECDFVGTATEFGRVCKTIYDSLNPKQFLDASTTNRCYRNGNKLYLDIVAKSK